MNEIKPINQGEFAGMVGTYGIINQGTGYAVVNVLTKNMEAHNISSYLDAYKTAEYLDNKYKVTEIYPTDITPPPPKNNELEDAIRGLKPDVQRLIRKYAPETVNVDKSTNPLSQSRYKCFDTSGNVLGRVRGKTGNRYWQSGGLSDQKHY